MKRKDPTASKSQPPAKVRRTLPPRGRRPTQLPNDYEATLRMVKALFDSAGEGDGREAPYYQPFNHAFNYFARCSEDPKVTIGIAPQYSFRKEIVGAQASDESTRDDLVDTRSRVKANAIPLNKGIASDGPEEDILGSDDITEGNISVLSNLQPNPNFRSESYLSPKDRWRTPDFVFFQHKLKKNDRGLYYLDSTPICIVEIKPLPIVKAGDGPQDDMPTLAARRIKRTCAQLSIQLDVLYSEFKDLNDVFAFIFVGPYYAFFTCKGRSSIVEHGGRVAHSLFDEDHDDFGEDFQKCWQRMMDANGIQIDLFGWKADSAEFPSRSGCFLPIIIILAAPRYSLIRVLISPGGIHEPDLWQNALETLKSEREKRKNFPGLRSMSRRHAILITNAAKVCHSATLYADPTASTSQAVAQDSHGRMNPPTAEKQLKRKRPSETSVVTATVSTGDDFQPALKKARTVSKTANTASSSTRPVNADLPTAASKSAAGTKNHTNMAYVQQAPPAGPIISPDESLERRREIILTEMKKAATKCEDALRCELESLHKKREEDIRAAMMEEYKLREDTLRAELESHYKKREADARTASTKRFDSVRGEAEKVHKQREDALRMQLELGFKSWSVQARIAFEKRQWDIRLEMEKEHKQREATLRAEFESLSQAEVEEHKRREADLRLELESLYQKRRAEDEHRSAVEMEDATAKLRAELESEYKRDADRCVQLEAELAVEKTKQVDMHRRIEILEEENAVLIAEKELGERKARLAALRGNGIK